ncbi:glycosyltransferase [Candidatus Shapirobacteria bacterium]|nr:glycosyltransferase [Candidatus Shapirobacteria bacterium]
MRIALVHDYLKEYGGAEGVLETLSDIFPNAPIYTSLYKPQFFGPHRPRLEKKWQGRVRQSFFQYFPFAHKLISPLRLLSPLAFGLFDFSNYDLIISSATGAYFPNSLNKKNAKLICYCHTPPRYLYGLTTARDLSRHKLIWFFAQMANHFLRLLDFKYSQNVDQYIANSTTTATRIHKFYRRDSVVINPPVNIPKVSPLSKGDVLRRLSEGEGFEPFYLTGGRLAFAKRYDIAIKACNQLGVPLKIFGRNFANVEATLRQMSGKTIEFLGEVTNEKRLKLMSEAQAFIFCSDNEDFGIVPVEAMSAGCPVIGYKSGGVTETVIDGKTGVLFDKLTPESCAKAISKVGAWLAQAQTRESVRQACVTQTQHFSKEKFIAKIKNLVQSL